MSNQRIILTGIHFTGPPWNRKENECDLLLVIDEIGAVEEDGKYSNLHYGEDETVYCVKESPKAIHLKMIKAGNG